MNTRGESSVPSSMHATCVVSLILVCMNIVVLPLLKQIHNSLNCMYKHYNVKSCETYMIFDYVYCRH